MSVSTNGHGAATELQSSPDLQVDAAPAPEPVRPPKLRVALWGDLAYTAEVNGVRFPSLGGLLNVLMLPGTWAVVLFRLASTAHHRHLRPLSRLVFMWNTFLTGAELHPSAIVQPGLVIPHPVGMGFGGGVRIGRRVRMFKGAVLATAANPKRPGWPVVGDDVVLMTDALVCGPVHVGDRSIVGARAVLVDDVPPDHFVYGPRKSDTFRPLAEMGLGERAEAEIGYGAAARRVAAANGHARPGSSPGASAH